MDGVDASSDAISETFIVNDRLSTISIINVCGQQI
jgi:hypothetical protein